MGGFVRVLMSIKWKYTSEVQVLCICAEVQHLSNLNSVPKLKWLQVITSLITKQVCYRFGSVSLQIKWRGALKLVEKNKTVWQKMDLIKWDLAHYLEAARKNWLDNVILGDVWNYRCFRQTSQ